MAKTTTMNSPARELTNVAIEHWVEEEGYGLRIAWEEGEPNLYLLETSERPESSARDTDERLLSGATGFDLNDNLPCRRLWLGRLNKVELERFLASASAMQRLFSE